MGPTNSTVPATITGIILCGGEGRRMGGVDKPLLPLAGQPLVSHVMTRLRPQVEQMRLIANRSAAHYEALGVPVHQDTVTGLGPLGGLLTALQVVTTPLLFVCPGDAPRLDQEIVARLRASLAPDLEAAFPNDGIRDQPLFLLIRATIRPVLESYLERGGRSVHGFLGIIRSRTVEANALADSFVNVNTPEDLQAIERGAG